MIVNYLNADERKEFFSIIKSKGINESDFQLDIIENEASGDTFKTYCVQRNGKKRSYNGATYSKSNYLPPLARQVRNPWPDDFFEDIGNDDI